MRIAITGASGFVGSPLVASLVSRGHEVVRFVRRRPNPGIQEAYWNPAKGEINENVLRSCDAVLCLSGAGIADKRWTKKRKDILRKSRVESVDFLARTLAGFDGGPQTLICASAIGIYGSRGDEELTEESALGHDFLSGVCRDWEAAADPARSKGIRVVSVRIGVVIGKGGGALSKMLLPFKMGLGGKIGNGQQWMSWIDIDDLVGILAFVVGHDEFNGAINAVAPNPVTNREFTKALGKALDRPTFLPAPGFMLHIVLGQMAGALLLSSQKVGAKKIIHAGYEFLHPRIESSLKHAVSDL